MDYLKYLLNIPTQKIKYGLSRTYKLLEICDNPEKNIKSIQIVGTNGKGSVSAFLTNILVKSKYKIGWYTSPHLVKLNERIKINFKSISNSSIEEFLKLYYLDIKRIQPSFFEIMTAMAMWYFKKNKVDFAVLETGLGGRLDSVTACNNIYVVFTPIAIDHSEILGDTIDQIAKEKAGAIISGEQTCISIKHKTTINSILDNQAKKHNIQINYLQSKSTTKIKNNKMLGEHQKNNALLAKHVIKILVDKKEIKTNTDFINQGISNTIWPGRFQTVNKEPTIIFDVCHNHQGVEAFKNTLIKLYNNKQTKYLICGFEHNKKIIRILQSLAGLFDEIICTEAGARKSMPAKTIMKGINNNHSKHYISFNRALDYVLDKAQKNDIIFIIGSHFFAPDLSKRYKNCFAIDK